MQPSIQEIFHQAAQLKASDVHLAAGHQPIVRVDGELRILKEDSVLTKDDTQKIAADLLEKSHLERFYKERELDIAYQLPNGDRFRVNFSWALGTIAIAARVLNDRIPTLEELTMPPVVYELTKLLAGLILVTGPTGCGKTTHMAAMIERINEEQSKHIITLEDPIEYVFQSKMSLVKQREYGTDFLTFPEGLKRVLRQDPDIIMVGEMRDAETMSAALTLAETGHLVFATLHTYSGPQTIDRIADSFPPHQQQQVRLQMSLTLKAVVSQRLLPKIDGGRIAAREVLINTNAASNLIRENKIAQLHTVIETGGKYGMVSMERSLKNLVAEGIVSQEQIENHLNTAKTLKKEGEK